MPIFERLTRMFSTSELIIMGVILLVVILLIVGNILLAHFYKKHAERKLCTTQLQNRREQLLNALEEMKRGGAFALSDEEEKEEEVSEEDIYADDDEDDDDMEMGVISADDDLAEAVAGADEASEYDRRLRVMKARDMTPSMREKFSLIGEEFDDKSYYVRYAYSFEAKLGRAEAKIQERYVALRNEIALYHGLKVMNSSKQQRIYKGRKTLGLIMFRGRTLCLALALNPEDYKDTKYRGIDMSEKKRFKATPMLFKLTSSRKIEYAKYLLVQLADANTIVMNDNPEKVELTFEPMTDGELFDSDKLKIYMLGEVPEAVLLKMEEAKQAAEEAKKQAEAEAAPAQVEEEVAAAKPKRKKKAAE